MKSDETRAVHEFDQDQAIKDISYQVSLGPRTVGSKAHRQAGDWIIEELNQAGWTVEIQETIYQGQPIRNIIGKYGSDQPWIILGAHYDSRLIADKDPVVDNWSKGVPGANDGASGVSVLVEIARVLPGKMKEQGYNKQVWLVFFDAEDNGGIPGWDWILGSRAFVQNLSAKPDLAVIIDMIGDRELNIYKERNSDQQITQAIWNTASKLGYGDLFIDQLKHRILDDHIPFIEAGIPAVDIIDFDYPYWHTTNDTPDKISAHSLKAVGDTLIEWLLNIE